MLSVSRIRSNVKIEKKEEAQNNSQDGNYLPKYSDSASQKITE